LEILEVKAEALWRLSSMVGQLFVRLETTFPPMEAIAPTLGELQREAKRLGLRSADQQLDRIGDLFKNLRAGTSLQTLGQDLRSLVLDLHLRICDDLESRFFISMPPENVEYYKQTEPLFGKGVDARFPSLSFEIDEAGKCYAFDRHTACVFHLMRILEGGIEAARKCLGIPDPVKDADRNWGAMLRKMKEEIDRRNRISAQQWLKPSDRDFFAEIYASLDAVRNVWRNATMHVEKKYTPLEAEHILTAVRGFMRKLADRVDEQGQPAA
jgi:hypothetical protein